MSRSLRPTARLSAETLEARALMSATLSTPPNPDLGTAALIGLLRPAADGTTTPPEPDRTAGGVTANPPQPDRTATVPPDPYLAGHPDLMLTGVYVDGGKAEPPEPDKAAIDFCRPGADREGIIVINMPADPNAAAIDFCRPATVAP